LELDKKESYPTFLSLFRKYFWYRRSRAHLGKEEKWRDAIRHKWDQTSGNLDSMHGEGWPDVGPWGVHFGK
jgi:hypothetical protein